MIRTIDLFKNPYNMNILFIIGVPRVPKRAYIVNNGVLDHIIKGKKKRKREKSFNFPS